MKILITGGSGLIGRELVALWEKRGDEVYQVTRNPDRRHARSLGYEDPIPEVEVIVNLAGELVIGYWTEAKKKRIMESRVQTTRWIIHQIQKWKKKPLRLISASAIGIYGDQGNLWIDENAPLDPENKFRYQVCKAWETEADLAKQYGVAVTKVRIGNVFAWKQRFLGYVYPFWKMGLFPRMATPSTWIPWISLRDCVQMIDALVIDHKGVEIINAVSPTPLIWESFEKIVRSYFPIRMTVPVDRLGMRWWMGEMSQALQDSQRIISKNTSLLSFQYSHSTIQEFFEENFE